jgi:hypothetical protein
MLMRQLWNLGLAAARSSKASEISGKVYLEKQMTSSKDTAY